ncbi:MAG: type VI secretion system accessory protein TagJ [Planctomycetaceae bacterium]
MTTVADLFRAGQLSEAVAAAVEAVRNNPTDIVARSTLSELLCFSGDLERADKQLDAAIQIDPDAVVGVSLLRHLIRSELSRREVMDQGRVPEFLVQPTEAQQCRLKALVSLREGDLAAAAQLLTEANDAEPDVSGECNGTAFEGFRDLDDVLGPTIEVYTATGKYYWLSADQIVSLEFSGIEHLSDMLWRAAEIQTVGEVTGRVHVPALYHGSHTAADQRVSIGRTTDWIQAGDGAPVRGAGQREWLVGEDVVAVTAVKTISFQPSQG